MSRHLRPVAGVSSVVVASLILTFGMSASATADTYPTWDEVENARSSQAATQAAASEIEDFLVGLEVKAADLGRTAQMRGEDYNVARNLLDTASLKAERLGAQADDAKAAATLSARRAAQLISQVARTGGGSVSLALMMSPDADNLLNSLGAVSRLTAQSTQIYEQAIHDQNLAESLTDQAKVAEEKRKALAADSAAALASAQDAAAAVQAQVDSQQAALGQLYEQLASLKGTTVAIEQGYLAGLVDAANPKPPTVPVTPPTTPTNPTTPGTPGTPPVVTPPVVTPPVVTPPVVTPPVVTPPVVTPPVQPPAPEPSSVESAIAFAYAQLGDYYEYGGYGPDGWDCSGLTKAAYAAAGIYIGIHGATSQYNYLAGQGKLVPYSQVQRGDLVFYSSDGYSMYHTGLYIGNGQMIEAQYEGVPVKVSSVRSWDLVGYVARPTG